MKFLLACFGIQQPQNQCNACDAKIGLYLRNQWCLCHDQKRDMCMGSLVYLPQLISCQQHVWLLRYSSDVATCGKHCISFVAPVYIWLNGYFSALCQIKALTMLVITFPTDCQRWFLHKNSVIYDEIRIFEQNVMQNHTFYHVMTWLWHEP